MHYSYDSVKRRLIQEAVDLRKCDREGLLRSPVFTPGKPNPTRSDRKDPAATPVVISLGLPRGGCEPQIPQPAPLEPVITPEAATIPGSPTSQSPSISFPTLSDFNTFDDESPLGPAVVTPHDTFYLEDGNVEVLCGNTLFRVNTSVLSFNSPVLSRTLAKASLASAESPNGCPRILSSDAAADFVTLLKVIYLPEFPERNKTPDFTTFSSLLRITATYEMTAARSRILDVVREAYPETFEGLAPAKPIGERVFSGPAPHPNEVLNLFVQQKLKSALPLAYYMAARRGLDSLMDRRLPASARLSPEVLHMAMKGLLALREVELKEAHRLILGSRGSRSCSQSNCPSRHSGPGVSEADQKVVDRITDSACSGTKILEVLSLKEVCGGDCLGFCKGCVGGWEAGHADVRESAWDMLPIVFGLKG